MRRYFFASSFACRVCSASSGRSPPLLYTTNSAQPSRAELPSWSLAVTPLAALAPLLCQCLFQVSYRHGKFSFLELPPSFGEQETAGNK